MPRKRAAAGWRQDSDGPAEVMRPGQQRDVTGVERVGREVAAAAEGEEDRYTLD